MADTSTSIPSNVNQPGDTQAAAPVDEFELMRRRLKARGATRGAGEQRQLTREFSKLGTAPSGAALRARQEAATQSARQTSEDIQGVNIAEAQTRRAERESSADRALKEFGITTQAETAETVAEIGAGSAETVAEIGAGSAENVANITTESAETISQNSINAATANLASQLENNLSLANIDANTKTTLGNLDAKTRMDMLKITDDTQRWLTESNLEQQLTIAEWQNNLAKKGMTIQEKLAEAGIKAGEEEGLINSYATFVNSVPQLKQHGFSVEDVGDIMDAMGIEMFDLNLDGQ